MKHSQKQKQFDPDKSYYHWVILNKYIKQGFTIKTAYKRARKEYMDSIKQIHLFGR